MENPKQSDLKEVYAAVLVLKQKMMKAGLKAPTALVLEDRMEVYKLVSSPDGCIQLDHSADGVSFSVHMVEVTSKEY